MSKEEIIKNVDFIISVGLFKIEDSIKILQFRSDLEEMGADIIVTSPDKAQEVVEKTKIVEKKSSKIPQDDDRPF